MIVFIDIETVSQFETFEELDERGQSIWLKRYAPKFLNDPGYTTPEQTYQDKAALFAEWSFVCCISVGYLKEKELVMKSYNNENESSLLQDFAKDMPKLKPVYCGHHIKGFDLPFIFQRFMANHIPFIDSINLAGKKPWEVLHIDTMELWKNGGFKGGISLDALTYHMGIPSPKDSIDGSKVGACYYGREDWSGLGKKERIDIITKYCERDIAPLPELLRVFGKL